METTTEPTQQFPEPYIAPLDEESKVIIELNDVDFYYGDAQALYNITMKIPEREVTAFIGALRLWKIYAPPLPEPHERPRRWCGSYGRFN
jgi:hypothetical protein